MITIIEFIIIIITFGQNFDFKIRKDNEKNSYERLVNESVDDSSLS